MSLTEFAERELTEAGLMSEGSDYDGKLGAAVLELVKVFAAQGHSGYSAHATIDLFRRVASYKPLNPLKNPTLTGEYIDHTAISDGNPVWQSSRVSSVLSDDLGKTWYDLDKRVPWWKRWLGVRRAYIKFAE